MTRTVVSSPLVPSSGKPYSPAIRHDHTLYVSGQVALEAGELAVEGGIEPQTRRVLDNLRALLEAGGSSMRSVLKTTCFLVDIGDAPRFNEIYRDYFPTDPPARSTIAVAALSPGYLVEVEAIAAVERP
ncbi:MAG TPA: RidA family protein [Candidatus Limnocylindria bacterium]|nr:RidA family protein [Candidatus Limnocylindria bacterium]